MKMERRWAIGLAAAVLALPAASGWAGESEGRKALVDRGRYVFATAGGCACHTPPGAPGFNAGGQKFEGSFGVVYSRNITPDLDTGIGRWTLEQVVNAIRRGERPDGTRLFPVHPYVYFALIADDEAVALAAYLKSAETVSHRVPPRALKESVPAIPARRERCRLTSHRTPTPELAGGRRSRSPDSSGLA